MQYIYFFQEVNGVVKKVHHYWIIFVVLLHFTFVLTVMNLSHADLGLYCVMCGLALCVLIFMKYILSHRRPGKAIVWYTGSRKHGIETQAKCGYIQKHPAEHDYTEINLSESGFIEADPSGCDIQINELVYMLI